MTTPAGSFPTVATPSGSWGLDGAGNLSTRDLSVRVDRTIRSLTWSPGSFVPAAGQKARVSFVLSRWASVTLSIYGGTFLRDIWKARPLGAGTYSWTWDGRTASGASLKPGTYRAIVTATNGFGTSTMTRPIVVKAP